MQYEYLLSAALIGLISAQLSHVVETSQIIKLPVTLSVNQDSSKSLLTKDYVPMPIFIGFLTASVSILATLIWKWHEAEVKRIEGEKLSEIKLLEVQRKSEILEKDRIINDLESKIKSMEREQKLHRDMTSTFPQEFLRETKLVLEMQITELKSKISDIQAEKKEISKEKEEVVLKLESALSIVENSFQKLSILEEYLAQRAVSIHEASSWLLERKESLAQEVCQFLLRVEPQEAAFHARMTDFTNDLLDYLNIVCKCLDIGRPNLLDKARKEIEPVVNPRFYAQAFKVINNDKVPAELNESSAREIQPYLDYLERLF